MPEKLKVYALFDFMGSSDKTTEEEAADAIEQLAVEGIEAELVGCTSYITDDMNHSVDMLLVDFGGVMPGAQDTIDSNLREVRKWAEEHPGKLVVIWTQFTAEMYYNAVDSEFGDIDNVIYLFASMHHDDFYESTFDRMDTMYDKIRAWYGR